MEDPTSDRFGFDWSWPRQVQLLSTCKFKLSCTYVYGQDHPCILVCSKAIMSECSISVKHLANFSIYMVCLRNPMLCAMCAQVSNLQSRCLWLSSAASIPVLLNHPRFSLTCSQYDVLEETVYSDALHSCSTPAGCF